MEIYDFGDRLKKLRNERGLSQEGVAERLNLTRSTVSAYERNTKTPRVEVLTQLALLYHASTDYILGIDDRTGIFLDDLSKTQQDAVLDIVERIKIEFRRM